MPEEWELTYQSGGHNNSWPWTDLISLYYRYVGSVSEKLTVFEYGCGTGNNYPFFKSFGFNWNGIEFSETAVHLLLQKYPELVDKVINNSFTDFSPEPRTADLIVDRAGLTHCNLREIQETLQTIFIHLKPGGLYIGIDWFSTSHSDFSAEGGLILETSHRDVVNNVSGQFAGLGKVHFTDSHEIRELFSDFEILHLSHKVIQDIFSHKSFASWSLVARKPNEVK